MDHGRRPLFAMAVLAILAVTVAWAQVKDYPPPEQTAQPQAAVARQTPEPEHAEPAGTNLAPIAALQEAKVAARGFLRGYLAYAYGRAGARAIEHATDRLRAALASAPPRVDVATGRRRARVKLLTAEFDGDGVAVNAYVDDGDRRYVVPVAMTREGGRWVAEDVG